MSMGLWINFGLVMVLVGVCIYLLEHPDTTGTRKKKFDAMTATVTTEGKVIWTKIETWVKAKV